ncbi:hypothetical protein OB2597_04350 [Pseudooceanicola batsensis HTCC2597]|uniref:Uncharacterized protein n=1 Tax=Pseudooceanicola batsensis (strain ATCC BAA-863 / DSM 15984 / KCTC 12145 / HTCC2597) TaxID=252305 RepID=A3U3K2_PSEBH|nr:hypothetical protein [Pseudooceanicola batsensis]EAQ01204.1 hypothetical protein OB2597_04350 [Pseudooceanicola batsensis HTCC2597]
MSAASLSPAERNALSRVESADVREAARVRLAAHGVELDAGAGADRDNS